MITNLPAVYENGTFRLMNNTQVPLKDGSRVLLSYDSEPLQGRPDILALAARVFEGLSDEDIAEVERIALDRTHFFKD